MIVTMTLNPAIDKTVELDQLKVGELNRLTKVRSDAGGKGINVSKTIHALGGTTTACGFLGKENSRIFEKCFKEYSIIDGFTYIDGETRTNLKIMEPGGKLTEINEPGFTVDEVQQQSLINLTKKYMEPGSLFVLSGSLPKGIRKDFYRIMTAKILAMGGEVFVDADGESFAQALEAAPTIIKPNTMELMQYFGLNHEPEEIEMIELGKKLLAKGPEMVCISQGGDGALLLTENKVYKAEPLKVEVHSTVGAGDAMVASLAYARAQKMDAIDSFRLALACSAGAVATHGTQPPTKELVDSLIKQTCIKEI
jgi:1-phosphofructokinase